MTNKGRKTIYIDTEKADRVKDNLDIDLSRLTGLALDIADSQIFDDIAVTLRTKIIDDTLLDTRNEIVELESRLVALNKRLVELNEKKATILRNYEETKHLVRLQEYMYQLNSIIIVSRYDLPTIAVGAKELIEKIQELNPLWKLDIHVAEFKKEKFRYG